jgi:hypothetical protein
MKTRLLTLLLTVSAAGFAYTAGQAISDPVQDYLSHFTFYDGNKNVYSSDRLLRLDIDLNNDGRKEVLLSMGRDRNGKQGNVWVVYKKTKSGYIEVGGMTFSASGFYLGEIPETGGYGLVTFWPAGAGEGVLLAYVYDGSTIREAQIGEVRRDPVTRELKGAELLRRYSGKNAIVGDDVIAPISAQELASKYGISVEAKTYEQVVRERAASRGVKFPASPPPTP